jgi:hypothetical protein
MAKAKTFADKIAKQQHDFTKHCRVCGESMSPVRLVVSELSDKTKSWKFSNKFVGLCKCNEKTIFG